MKTRMTRSVVSLAALIGALAPLAGHAANPALDKCVQMFVREVVPADYPSEIKSESIVASVRPINAARSHVMLIAQGEKRSKLFGRATCVIDRNGSLVAMYLYDTKPGRAAYGRPKLIARDIDATQNTRTASIDATKPF